LQAHRLSQWLEGLGLDVVDTREPTDGPWGRRYRTWACGDADASPDEVLAFFLNDRAEHVEGVIRPALDRGGVVVCDRYNPSTRAYQAAHGVDRETLRARIEARAFPEPDLVLWIRVPVSLALERLGEDATERYERREFLERVDEEYARLGILEVDGRGTPEEVGDRLREIVRPLLEERGLLKR
jgi:dTMP kinase